MRRRPVKSAKKIYGTDLGLYSITMMNDVDADLRTLEAFRAFRDDAAQNGFKYFLEVFNPNVPHNMEREHLGEYINDCILRCLAAVMKADRPQFLKIVYNGPKALEELATYDPSLVIGILGGGAGTNRDTFELLHQAERYGARVALFGRKINQAEAPLALLTFMRQVTDGTISPDEAVRAYHGELQKLGLKPLPFARGGSGGDRRAAQEGDAQGRLIKKKTVTPWTAPGLTAPALLYAAVAKCGPAHHAWRRAQAAARHRRCGRAPHSAPSTGSGSTMCIWPRPSAICACASCDRGENAGAQSPQDCRAEAGRLAERRHFERPAIDAGLDLHHQVVARAAADDANAADRLDARHRAQMVELEAGIEAQAFEHAAEQGAGASCRR